MTQNSNIVINVDSYNTIESALMQSLYSKDYTFPVEGLTTTMELFAQLQEELNSKYELETYNFCASASNQHYIFKEKTENSFLIIARSGFRGSMIIDFYTKEIKDAETIFNILKEYEDIESTINIKIVSFSVGGGGTLEKSVSNKNHTDFKNLSKKYYPYLDTDELFKQYLISNDNLLLLAAQSGTGKTKIVDMLFDFCIKNYELLEHEEDIDENDDEKGIFVAYVKNPSILAMDSFWNDLSRRNYHFVIMDDVDHILIDRNISNGTIEDDIRVRFISNFLSYTDGIFSNSTKFIITTNQGVNDIDSAILRKGRCFDVLSFRYLTKNEAKDIWLEAELEESLFEDQFKDIVDVSSADLGAKIEFQRNLLAKNETVKSSYILEDNISLYKTSKHKKIKV